MAVQEAFFQAADVLLPEGVDMEKWSVAACDQYTAQPEYWERVRRKVGGAPSTFHLILPEAWLDSLGTRVEQIHKTMDTYLARGLFQEYKDSYIYVERRTDAGIRRGLVGRVDLEAYDYRPGAGTPVRPTEETVEIRIPARVHIREGASLELPHILLLLNDPGRTVIEQAGCAAGGNPLYSFNLMEGGGSIRGYVVPEPVRKGIDGALASLFAKKGDGIRIVVGDGNHSLAAAKVCWESLKKTLPESQRAVHPARWALAELENIYDESIRFEAIHRLVTGIDPQALLNALAKRMGLYTCVIGEADFRMTSAMGEKAFRIGTGCGRLATSALQKALDECVPHLGGIMDYIHGEQTARSLASRPDAVAFLLPAMDKSCLIPEVGQNGALPRKTFSMGEANEKRYYLECRKIR